MFPNAHAGYYPGAKPIALKFIFRKSNGRVLGAQALGEDGPAVDEQISALAVATRWARPFTTSKKPSCATRRSSAAPKMQSTSQPWSPQTFCTVTCRIPDQAKGAFLLDVREPVELESLPGAVNIPIAQLRSRLGELPRGRDDDVPEWGKWYARRTCVQKRLRNEAAVCRR